MSDDGKMRMTGPRDVLFINLTTRTAERRTLPAEAFRGTLGGVGLAVALIDELVTKKVDPLGPENVVVFASGPFAGTPIPAGTKHAVATISPLTGLLSEGLSSSHWSGALRGLGLAALVVAGAARGWTTLVVGQDGVRFESADAFIGLDPKETAAALRAAHGDRRLRVCAIGVAGENGVLFAALENDGRQAGRGGVGAVLGAKRLKAIALGPGRPVELADADRTHALALDLKKRYAGPKTAKYRLLGTGANMRVLARMGQLPARNFTASTFAGVELVTPERARENPAEYTEIKTGCAGCPVQCEHMYVRRDSGRKAAASEYESVWAFGPNCGVDDLDAVLDAIERCDRYGLDTISTGGVIAFAMECAARGLIDEHVFGPELTFGNARVLAPAVDAIAVRSGFGAVLALGVRAAAERVGGDAASFAMHAKGLELPGYEPRALPTYALGLAVCTRGACHNRAATYDTDLRNPDAAPAPEQRVKAAVEAEDYAIVWDSLVLCKFVRDCFDDFYAEAAMLYSAVTGLDVSADDLRRGAQQTWERKRAINARQGWTPADDVIPARLFTPLADGPHTGRCIRANELKAWRSAYERLRVERTRATVQSSRAPVQEV